MKNGTEEDIANLPAPTRYNNPHKNKRTCKRRRTTYDHAEEEEEDDVDTLMEMIVTQEEAL